MSTVLSIVAAACFFIGAITTIGNWYLLCRWLSRRKSGSFVPVLGGLLMCVGLMGWDSTLDWWIYALAFVIDIGSAPLIVGTVGYLSLQGLRGKASSARGSGSASNGD